MLYEVITLWAKGRRVFAQRIDPKTGDLTGQVEQVVDDVAVSHTNGTAAYAVSSQGTLRNNFV